jgi:hypothetical protein
LLLLLLLLLLLFQKRFDLAPCLKESDVHLNAALLTAKRVVAAISIAFITFSTAVCFFITFEL